ncbi:MAG: DNA internalization-related competence protein ComEC/Rec2 [Bacilli bacterium]|nr:DNA internalization-related competence protein ComEC/Rec2 [Bacilli bacterium]
MIKLRKILLSNYFYLLLVLVSLPFIIHSLFKTTKSIYSKDTKEIKGIVTNYFSDGDQLKLYIKGKEQVIATYYFKTKKEKQKILSTIQIDDKLSVKGILKRPDKNTTDGLFNYRKYLERKKIYYLMEIEEISLVEKNHNLFYGIKNLVFEKTKNPYLRTFILGDQSLMSKSIIRNYQELGISHLFAISGMHISLLSMILLKIFQKLKLKEKTRYLLVGIFLCFYFFLVGCSPSILRAILFFILFSVNKIYYFYIKPIHIFILVTVISLLINPNYLYDIAFLYSFSIAFSLIMLGGYINQYKNYLIKLFITSFISFIVSLPITLYSFNQVNPFSIIYNLFYVPLISIAIFPLAFITFFIPPLERIFNLMIMILEQSSNLLNQITCSKLIFCDIPYIFYFVYGVFIILFFFAILHKKYLYIVPLFLMILFHYTYPYLMNKDYLVMLNIGQGDSTLLHSNNKNVLIDTGGNQFYDKEKWKKRKNKTSIVKNITIPYLKKQGIKKIDLLILTHGDFDHLGEAMTLIKDFSVKKILINEGKLNRYEEELIKTFPNVKKSKAGDYFEVGNLKFLSLNQDLGDENDSSLVFYIKSNTKRLLFMGDASYKSEESIMNQYELEKIDILKVGHHGSRTSSSLNFLKKVKPRLALISAGKNNKFNHPHKEILNRFNRLGIKYLITKEEGSIRISL